ncbi:ABC transporter ATP-binding protein [Candidatus Geothermarchaeota archaeon]|nr:MAG: ABC transporter ATP-binding protein [Candidatus Geothermarchaeota archaeon]
MLPEPIIEMENIIKIYPDGVVALKGVDLTIWKREIHAILGENGAGKTTLMRILYGEIKPTSGAIKINGEEVDFHGPWDAIKRGIGMVYQHFTLIPTFTVLENLHLSLLALDESIKAEDVETLTRRLMDELGLKIPLYDVVEDLPIGVQQRVEIIKTLLRKANILILDEPTSVLTPIEVEELFKMLRKLKKLGITIIFITHKLREVKAISDRVTIMRRGKVVATLYTSKVSEEELARLTVDIDLTSKPKIRGGIRGRRILSINALWVRDERGLDAVEGVSLELYEGEILGLAGVQGNGQKELIEAIVGIRRAYRGSIKYLDQDITSLSVGDRYKLGISYVPDSRNIGLVYGMNLTENSILTNLHNYLSGIRVINWSEAYRTADKIVREYNVVAPSLRSPIQYLSGGNQQKVMVGREATREPKVFIVSEPTHGLDVRATRFIRNMLVKLRDLGKSILLVSTDLDEIMELSNRIAVIYGGRIMSVGDKNEYTIKKLGLLMGGIHEQRITK